MDTTRARPDGAIAPELIKFHGSTNWLTAYTIRDEGSHGIVLTHDLDPSQFAIFVSASRPYDCFAGRYMEGYAPYSYGYYPPNLNFPGRAAPPGKVIVSFRPRVPWKPEGSSGDAGLVSMPLIIPPVKRKTYDIYGALFRQLWTKAEERLVEADEIVVIGYSFPATDTQSDNLFRRAFSRRASMPRVTILDPSPERAPDKFVEDLGITTDRVKVVPDFFTRETDLASLVAG